MVQMKRNHFLDQFFMPLFKVWSDLYRVLAKKERYRSFWLADKEFQPVRGWCLELTQVSKRITRAWKNSPEYGLFSCVCAVFCLKSLVPLVGCAISSAVEKSHQKCLEQKLLWFGFKFWCWHFKTSGAVGKNKCPLAQFHCGVLSLFSGSRQKYVNWYT